MRLDFSLPRLPDGTRIVNDGVMGGVSAASLSPGAEGLLFAGIVSPENGGGFCSFRMPVSIPDDAATLTIHVRGDGRRYKLVLRGEDDGFQYQAGFIAEPAWQLLRFEPADFSASHRGQPVEAPPLWLADMCWLGLLISEAQYGPFSLRLRLVEAA